MTDNHQYKNAKVLADAGAAVLLPEDGLSEGVLTETVASLLQNREERRLMGEKIGSFAIKNTNFLIYTEIKNLVLSKKV